MHTPFWRGKRVLITGHTGFKGSWLSLWLQTLSAELTGYALEAPTDPSLFELAGVGEGMFSVTGDVRNLDNLKRVIAERRPEIIIHLAAQSLVRTSYLEPIETYESNVMGTANLLEAVRLNHSARVVLIVTSDKCYENTGVGQPCLESEAMGGHDPYSSSKGCAELIASAYRNSYFNARGIAVATARAGNVFGGGDWAKDRLIPDIFEGFLNDKAIHIRYPQAIRPWQHVQNALEGYLILAERLWENSSEFSEAWNFGPEEDETRSVEWLVNFLRKAWGDTPNWRCDETSHFHETAVLRLDSQKARTRLPWRPSVSLEAGLISLVAWYRAFQAQENMQQVTLQQILKNQERVVV